MSMKPMKALIALDEAMRILMDAVTPLARTERVELLQAAGRVLAEPITAPLDVPPFTRAAMDGYAVIAQNTFGAGNFSPALLRLLEVVHAGDLPAATVTAGCCVQVATGSPVPPGADAVVQVEDTELDGERAEANVKIYSPVYPGQPWVMSRNFETDIPIEGARAGSPGAANKAYGLPVGEGVYTGPRPDGIEADTPAAAKPGKTKPTQP